MRAFGLGAKIFDIVFYGERNWRSVDAIDSGASLTRKLCTAGFTITEYDIAVTYGLILGGVYEILLTSIEIQHVKAHI